MPAHGNCTVCRIVRLPSEFERGAGNQVLRTGFETYAKEQETFPAVMNRSGSYSTKVMILRKSVKETAGI